jgi:hypothetical protein
LLDESHAEHYLVFNLSQRVYDYEKFHGRVVDWCGFPDHHGAPLPLLIRTVKAMHEFLMADPRNVVVVHCLAGKGRTGTVIVAFMLYVGLFRTPNAASVFFRRQTVHQSLGCHGTVAAALCQLYSSPPQSRRGAHGDALCALCGRAAAGAAVLVWRRSHRLLRCAARQD